MTTAMISLITNHKWGQFTADTTGIRIATKFHFVIIENINDLDKLNPTNERQRQPKQNMHAKS